MNHTRQIFLVFLLVFFAFSVSAQQNQTRTVGGIEIGAGFNFFGPSSQMADLMEEYGFNDDINDWVAFESEEFPNFIPVGLSFQFAYSHRINPVSRWSILMQYSWFNKVYGYSDVSGHLDVRFTSLDLIPVYIRELKPFLEVQIGPSLMINSGKKTSLYDENVSESNDWYVKLSPALYAGLTFSLWDGTDTYGKIGANYQLTIPVNMGPYTAYYGFDSTAEIPETKIGFSHMSVVFTLGFHLWQYQD